jgi:hypothetical protein
MDKNILGFNLATLFHSKINKKPVMIHNVDLAITSGQLSTFRRLMTVISNQRGYALQRCFPEMEVITTYNAISIQSLIQANGVNHFPKLDVLSNEIPQILDIIDPYAETKQTEYAIFKKANLKPPIDQAYKRKAYFEKPSDLEHQFISGLKKPKGNFGFFVALPCNQQNYEKHCELISPDLGDLFKLTVNALTEHYLVNRWVSEHTQIPKGLPGFFSQSVNSDNEEEIKQVKSNFKSKL